MTRRTMRHRLRLLASPILAADVKRSKGQNMDTFGYLGFIFGMMGFIFSISVMVQVKELKQEVEKLKSQAGPKS